jgi:tetratricopeptide (TPR) repeat protein
MPTLPGCPYCGAPVKAESTNCPYCGKNFSRLTTVQQKQSRLSKLAVEIGRKTPTVEQMLELGELTLALGQNAQSVNYLRAVIKHTPEAAHPRLLLCLALLGFNQPNVESSVHAKEIGMHVAWLKEHYVDFPPVIWMNYYLEMQRLSRTGDWPRAVALGKQSVDEFPDNYLLHSILAAALLRFGKTAGLSKQDYQMAMKYMKLAAELNPDYSPAVRNVKALEKMINKVSTKE